MSAPTFSQDLTGMRVSASGILLRKENNKGLKFMRSELHKHLQTLAEHYYAGSQTIVDEFLQLYCLGEEHRKAAKEKAKEAILASGGKREEVQE